jgi:2-aminobenzoylacetyl-CoA thioesterase
MMQITMPPAALADNLWMLGSSAYPFYVVRDGGSTAIFEGGIGASARLLAQQMAQLGIDAGAVGTQLVVTHAHPDHVMAVPRLRDAFPGLSVVASAAAARTLAAEKAIGAFAQVDEMLTQSLLAAGTMDEQQRPGPLGVQQIVVDRVVKEGDTLAVGRLSFAVLETPGHSECSLSFYEPNRKLLVISDATGYYMPQHRAWWPNYFTDYGAYLHSMERLAGLDAEVLCLSHNAAIVGAEDVRAYLAGALAATKQYHQRIIAETAAGKSVREIAEQLGTEIYAKTPLMPVEFFQKNCGLLAKLSLRHTERG